MDALCAEARAAIDTSEAALKEAATPDEAQQSIRDVADTFTRLVSDVQDVEKPDDDRATLDEWIDVLEQTDALFRQLVDAAESADQESLRSATAEAEELESRGQQLAEDYGFDECAAEDD